MPLPDFEETGDLPVGVYRVNLQQVLERFGGERGPRGRRSRSLVHVYDLARSTKHLQRVIIFGSYVTATEEPNDIDVVLVMDDAFRLSECPVEARGLFDHAVAQARYGASVFWIRPGLLINDSLDEFIGAWQRKRDGSKRGIVEVLP
jgi:hypothetical protein